MTRRVAVTGLGVICPLGNSVPELRRRLLAGTRVTAPVGLFDASAFATTFAAEVAPGSFTPHPVLQRDRKIAFALHAAEAALRDAQFESLRAQHGEAAGGVCLGVGLELFSMPDAVRLLGGETPPAAHRLARMQTPSDICLHLIGQRWQLRQPPLLHVSACAASTDAIGTAFRLIRAGRRSWVLTGGADSMINPMGLGGFCTIQAMSRRNDDPAHASRPFDRDRDGFVLGEGAGMLVLEDWEHAVARGATIHAELLGYGNSFDAYSISDPHPNGTGAAAAMRRALADAGLAPEAVAHISAHGTSTPKNDVAETLAIRQVFGPHADRLAVNAAKSMLGHAISASGAVELVGQIACGRPDANATDWAGPMLHGTINLSHPDPACDLDYVSDGPRPLPGPIGLKNSFGFGGQNACLAYRIGSEP